MPTVRPDARARVARGAVGRSYHIGHAGFPTPADVAAASAGTPPDVTPCCFEEAMRRCDMLRRSTAYRDLLSPGASPRPPRSGGRWRPLRPASPSGDLRAVREEDAPPVSRRRRANTALQLAEPTVHRIVACGACGHWLFRDLDVLREEERAAQLTLDDSDRTVCARRANTQPSEEGFVINAVKKQRADEDWAYLARNALCGRCGIFLGVEIVRTCEPSADFVPVPTSNQSRAELLLWLLFETSRKHASISPPRPGWLRSQQTVGAATDRGAIPFAGAQRRGGTVGAAHMDTSQSAAAATAPQAVAATTEVTPWAVGQQHGTPPQGRFHRTLRRCCGMTGLCTRRACRHRAGSGTDSTASSGANIASGSSGARHPASEVSDGSPGDAISARTPADDMLISAHSDLEMGLRSRTSRRGGQQNTGTPIVPQLNVGQPGSAETQASGGSSGIGVGSRTLRTGDAVQVGQYYFGTRYIRLLDASPLGLGRRGSAHPVTPIICASTSCNCILSYSDMILDCNRRWSLGDGIPERAIFMNALCDGSFFMRNQREHRLAQGVFDMSDIHCKGCGLQVGYAFIRDKSEEERNINQVGRYGLVSSRIGLKTGVEVYVAAGRCQATLPDETSSGPQTMVDGALPTGTAPAPVRGTTTLTALASRQSRVHANVRSSTHSL